MGFLVLLHFSGVQIFSIEEHVSLVHPSMYEQITGGENVGVWMAMYDAYEEEQRLVFTGKSVHNQRVERNNRDLNVAITSPFKSVFQELQLEGNLDVDNETDMFCLHYIYLPRINQALTNHKNAHNHHKLSTEGSATPLQLYTVNIPLQTSHDSQVRNSVQDHVLPDLPETSVVTVPKLHCPLSVKGFQLLEATINPL